MRQNARATGLQAHVPAPAPRCLVRAAVLSVAPLRTLA